MTGFLNILKPPGMTSAAVVSVVRHTAGEPHVGHAGTLDPDAAGVLPIMMGRATRLFDYLIDKEKEYVAEVAFGASTDTQDAGGTVLLTGDRIPDLETVRQAAAQLTGDITQRPSAFCAVKKDGHALYKMAHKGQTVEVPERVVHVDSIDVQCALPRNGYLMTIRCGRGTYVRSICDDMGKLTGCPAHMRFLLRVQSGVFGLDSAMTLEDFNRYVRESTLEEHLIPADQPLSHLPVVHVPRRLQKHLANGMMNLPFWGEDVPENTHLRVYINDRFWGIGKHADGIFVWESLIPPEGSKLLQKRK